MYLKSSDGDCPVDIENPYVMIKGDTFGENYQKGSLVYPIGSNGEAPGTHPSEGWKTITTLNTNSANFCGIKVGETGIALKDLLNISGDELGISYINKRFMQNDLEVESGSALNQMLDYYALMQVPENARDGSKVLNSELSQHESGIIFDSLGELTAALKLYDSGILESSKATENKLFKDLWTGSGVDDASVYRQSTAGKLVQQAIDNQGKGNLVDDIIAEINTMGKYSKSFDYDAMSTAFFKTNVDAKLVGDKYVLGLSAAYVGKKPEIDLAEKLGNNRMITSVTASYELEPNNDWIGINVAKAMKGALTEEQIETTLKLSAGESKIYGGYITCVMDTDIKLSLGITQEENYGPNIIRVSEKLFMEREGDGKSNFSFTISPKEEGISVIHVRDELSKIVSKNLGC